MNPHESEKHTAFASVKPWIKQELLQRRHRYEGGTILVTHGGVQSAEIGYKCVDPGTGETYFYFHDSVQVAANDVLVCNDTEKWFVLNVTSINSARRCSVRQPVPTDEDVDQALVEAGLVQAATYLNQAKERLSEGTPAARSECKANCRNALQSVIEQLTGVKGMTTGIPKLKDVLGWGVREKDYLKAFDKLLSESMQILSKAGPHPPMPDASAAIFSFEITKATLKFLANCARQKSN